jgi:hypothetical protein
VGGFEWACERIYEAIEDRFTKDAQKVADKQVLLLTIALTESLKLQRHYAGLLNMHDGGQRIMFNSVDEWIERLKDMGMIPAAARR